MESIAEVTPQTESRAKTTRNRATFAPGKLLTSDDRQCMIAEAAYFRAERRGFAPGGELDDWIEAELEIDRTLAGGEAGKQLAPA